MVLAIYKQIVHPDKLEAHAKWAQQAIPRMLAGPGLVELRGYRPAAGSTQIVVTFEFATLADWAAFASNPEMLAIIEESRAFLSHNEAEIWGPSPVLPEPIRPGG